MLGGAEPRHGQLLGGFLRHAEGSVVRRDDDQFAPGEHRLADQVVIGDFEADSGGDRH